MPSIISKVKPTSPKEHGAWLGSGVGVAVGSVVVGLIQSYITHKALPLTDITLIDGVCGAVVSYVGARILPLLQRIEQPPPTSPVGPVVVPPGK